MDCGKETLKENFSNIFEHLRHFVWTEAKHFSINLESPSLTYNVSKHKIVDCCCFSWHGLECEVYPEKTFTKQTKNINIFFDFTFDDNN